MSRPPGFGQRNIADDPGQVVVIVVAAGESSRMGGVDKIFAPLLGTPLIAHTIDAFERCPLVGQIFLMLSDDNYGRGIELVKEMGWSKLTPKQVSPGGPRRQDSVRYGVEMVDWDRYTWVAVHDGARPCVEPQLLERGLEAARETGAAVAAVPAKDTVKVVSPGGIVESTPARASLWMVQTPQIFSYQLLVHAHRAYAGVGVVFTDDAAMVEELGREVKVFMGSYSNIKVTTPEDIGVAELFLKSRLASRRPSSAAGS